MARPTTAWTFRPPDPPPPPLVTTNALLLLIVPAATPTTAQGPSVVYFGHRRRGPGAT